MTDAHVFKIFLVISSKTDAKSNTCAIPDHWNMLLHITNTNIFGQMFSLKLQAIIGLL